jgi:hypothetical protein
MQNMEAFAIQIAHVALWSPAVVLGLGLWRLRSRSPAQHVWMVQLALAMAAQWLGQWLSSQQTSNLPIFHVHILLEFTCYVGVIYLGRSAGLPRKWTLLLCAAFGVFWCVNAAWGEGIAQVPTVALSVESVLLSALAVRYFVHTFYASQVIQLEREFLFWFSIGLLILFLGNILISFFLGSITARADVYFQVWTIRSSLIILTNLVFLIAITCKDPQTKS